jgi:hypothetical protein
VGVWVFRSSGMMWSAREEIIAGLSGLLPDVRIQYQYAEAKLLVCLAYSLLDLMFKAIESISVIR